MRSSEISGVESRNERISRATISSPNSNQDIEDTVRSIVESDTTYGPEVYGDEVTDNNDIPSKRGIIIEPLNSGYLVKVGCQTVAVETTKTLLRALGEYLENPNDFEIKWNKNKNRNKL